MKNYSLTTTPLSLASPAFALDGTVQIHDPSTIIHCAGKFDTLAYNRRQQAPIARVGFASSEEKRSK